MAQTIPWLKSNLIDPLVGRVKVFACLQLDGRRTGARGHDFSSCEQAKEFLQLELGESLASLRWFSHDDPWYLANRDLAMARMRGTVSKEFREYLGLRSGSMVEYYQMQLSYVDMQDFEQSAGSEFVYVMRMRPDVVPCKRIDFAWLDLDGAAVAKRLARLSELGCPAKSLAGAFMATLLQEDLVENFAKVIVQEEHCGLAVPDSANPEALADYVRMGHYALTFRRNMAYIVRRDLFRVVPALGTCYALLRGPTTHWCDAESQLRAIFLASGLSVYDYETVLESESLYSYRHVKYFEADGALRKLPATFFILRLNDCVQ